MTSTKTASSPKKNGGGAVARSERKSKRTLKFEGLTLKLPAKLPFRVLRHMNENAGIQEALRFIEDVLGEEQMEAVWNLDIDIDRGSELVEEILGAYGMAPGDSSASPKS